MNYKYNSLVVAGTFDRLHKAHEKLLETAFNSGRQVLCGITKDEMNRNKILAKTIKSFDKRQEELEYFLKLHLLEKRATVIPISDRFGTADTRKELEAIVTTPNNDSQVDLINNRRQENNLPILGKIIFPLVNAEDNKPLSSSRIRLGELNRAGKVYSNLFRKNLVLPGQQRKYFHQPLGELWTDNDLAAKIKSEINKSSAPLIICVGDIITKYFVRAKLPLSLGVIDKYSQRQPLPENFHHKFSDFSETTDNKRGTISVTSVNSIIKLLPKLLFEKKNAVLEVCGEEDLLVLPSVLLAPLESLIFYGQPNEGVVKIRVTEEIKETFCRLVKKFN